MASPITSGRIEHRSRPTSQTTAKFWEQRQKSRHWKSERDLFQKKFNVNKNLVVNIINNTFKKVKNSQEVEEQKVRVNEQREEERIKIEI